MSNKSSKKSNKSSKKSNKSSKKSNKSINKSNKSNKTKKTNKINEIKLKRELLNDVPKEYINYNHLYGFPPIKPKNNNYEKNVATFGINTKIQDINKILNLGF